MIHATGENNRMNVPEIQNWDYAYKIQIEEITYITYDSIIFTLQHHHLEKADKGSYACTLFDQIDHKKIESTLLWETIRHYQTTNPNHPDHSLHFFATPHSHTLKLYVLDVPFQYNHAQHFTYKDLKRPFRTYTYSDNVPAALKDVQRRTAQSCKTKETQQTEITQNPQDLKQQTQLQNLKSQVHDFRRKY
jgi:hypothetical protein